jgi:beta-lactamase regulating signal transducer with metallopeptidase domain/protocatechuate 3,4-dioxygenase beta subunit
MSHATLFQLDAWAKEWFAWMAISILDASVVLVFAGIVWLAIRKKAAAGVGCFLFLLVLIKLVVPLEIPVSEDVAKWTPRRVASGWWGASTELQDTSESSMETSQPSPVMRPRTTDQRMQDASASIVALIDQDEPTLEAPPLAPERAVEQPFEGSIDYDVPSSPFSHPPFLPPDFEHTESSEPAQFHDTTMATPPSEPILDATSEEETSTALPVLAAEAPASRSANRPPQVAETTNPIVTLLMLAWVTAATSWAVRSLGRHYRFRKHLRRAQEIGPSDLPCDFLALCERMGVMRRVKIVESDALSSPAVYGIFRSMIILPKGFIGSLAKEQMEWILLHELAHIRRHDLAMVWFQWFMSIVHFLNPAVWIANRIINQLREYACDDLASAYATGSTHDSSEAFMTVVRRAASRPVRMNGAPGVFDEGARASCFRRMARLVDTERRLRVRLTASSMAILLVVAALVLPQLRPAGNTVDATLIETTDVRPTIESPDVNTQSSPTSTQIVPLELDVEIPLNISSGASDALCVTSLHRMTLREEDGQLTADIKAGLSSYPKGQWRVAIDLLPTNDATSTPLASGDLLYQNNGMIIGVSLHGHRDLQVPLGSAETLNKATAVRVTIEPSRLGPPATEIIPVELGAKVRLNQLSSGAGDQLNIARFYEVAIVEEEGCLFVNLKGVTHPEPKGKWRLTADLLPTDDTASMPLASANIAFEDTGEMVGPSKVSQPEFQLSLGSTDLLTETSTLNLTLVQELNPPIEVAGRVLDAQGRPIQATVFYRDESGRYRGRAASDENGRFTFADCPKGLLAFQVTAHNSGYAPAVVMADVGESTDPLEILLPKGRTIHVRAVNQLNESPESAYVRFGISIPEWGDGTECYWIRDMPFSALDEDGCFTWMNAPVAPWFLQVSADLHEPVQVPVAPDENGDITVQMKKRIASQRFIIHLKDPDPESEVNIEVWPEVDHSVRHKGGGYEVTFYEQRPEYLIHAEAEGYLPMTTQYNALGRRPGDAIPGAPWKPRYPGDRARLPRITTPKQICVTPDGKPAADVDVCVSGYGTFYGVENGRARTVFCTDQEGRVLISAYVAEAGMTDQPPHGMVFLHDEGYEIMTRGEYAASERITLKPWSEIAGQALLEGQAISNWTVSLKAQPHADEALNERFVYEDYEATTDSEGRFAFDRLIPGRYDLTLFDPEKAEETPETIPDPDGGRLGLGNALPGLFSPGHVSNPPQTEKTFPSPAYRITVEVAPGETKQVQFEANDATRYESPSAPPVPETPEPREQRSSHGNQRATCEPISDGPATEPHDYRFRVVRLDAPGVGVAGASVFFSRRLLKVDDLERVMTTDAEGRGVLRNWRGSTWCYAKTTDDQWVSMGRLAMNHLITDPPTPPEEITITLRPAAKIKGRIVDSKNNPVAGAEIDLPPNIPGGYIASGSILKSLFIKLSATDGTFESSALPPGRQYELRARKEVPEDDPNFVRNVGYGGSFYGSYYAVLHEPHTFDVGDVVIHKGAAPPSEPDQLSVVTQNIDVAAIEQAYIESLLQMATELHGVVRNEEDEPVAGCDVQLIGRVEEDHNNAPATVYRSEKVKTDSQGRYVISSGPIGPRYIGRACLYAESPDGTQRGGLSLGPRLPQEMTDQEEGEITIHPTKEKIVRVLNSEGRPVEGASVEIVPSGLSSGFPRELEPTDSNGETRFRWAVSFGSRPSVRAIKSGVGMAVQELDSPQLGLTIPHNSFGMYNIDPEEEQVRVDITLEEAITRRFQILDMSGRALQGLVVRPTGVHGRYCEFFNTLDRGMGSDITCRTTDEQGIVTFDWLSNQLSDSELIFETFSHMYGLNPRLSASLDAAKPDELIKVNLPQCAIVSGRITSPDGSPAVGLRVEAGGIPNWGRGVFTDADGRYTYRLPPNKIESFGTDYSSPDLISLRVSYSSNASHWVGGEIGYPMFLAPGESVENVDQQLLSGTTVVQVRLVIDEGDTSFADLIQIGKNQGRLEPSLRMSSFYPENISHLTSSSTYSSFGMGSFRNSSNHKFDSNGEVWLQLPAGSYALHPIVPCVEWENIERYYIGESGKAYPKKEFVITPSNKVLKFEFHVSTDQYEEYLLKTVTACEPNVAAPDIHIRIRPEGEDFRWHVECQTNDKGKSSILRSDQPITYLAYSDDHKLAAFAENSEIDPNSNVVTIPMRATREVTGIINDGQGRPMGDCHIVCRAEQRIPTLPIPMELTPEIQSSTKPVPRVVTGSPTEFTLMTVITDDEGRFHLDNLLQGVDYKITAWQKVNKQRPPFTKVGETDLTVEIDESPTPDIIDCGNISGLVEN